MTDLNDNTAAVTVRGTIEKLFHSSPRFSAGRLRVDAWQTVSFAGSLMVRVHDAVILHGRWETHAKYGQQLKVSRFEFDQKPSAEGLAQYLANHPALKGIGPVRARRIADAFGADFDRVIEEEPERVAELAKVPRNAVDLLRDEWLRTRTLNASLSWLSAFELTYFQATTLIAKLGNSVVAALTEDPYRLVREIPGFGFKRIDLIARRLGTPKDHPGRIRAGVVHCVAERVDQGDCWVEDETLVELANGLLVMDELGSKDQIAAALDELIQDGTLACRSIGGRFLIAQPRLLEMELDLARVFTTQLAPNPHFAGAARAAAIRGIDARLNADQRRAVQMAIEHNLVVISGAAGSGKSFLLGAITNLYVRREKSVVLAAPTGKAAKRIEEVVRREATTIHRLLAFNGAAFARGPDDPIDADVVIVDEVSMVDIPLAWHLFRAIDFERTCVVLVGDHEQLPSVGPGSLLRDLIERQPVPTVILDQVVRQAGVLKENSLAVLRGEVRKTAPPDASGCYPWVVANKFTQTVAAQHYVLELFDHVLVERLGFDLRRDVQLLTPTKKGALGVDELNMRLQRIVQKKLWGVVVPPPLPKRRPALLLHDRVIQTRNNYDLGVMNGAVGVVTHAGDKPGELAVRFDDRQDVAYTSETARELSLAYALTVHKCVGPHTLVETPQGLLPIRSIRRDGGVVATPDGPRPYDTFVENPDGELLELVTVDGYCLTVTPEHGIDVWTEDGFARVEAQQLAPGAILRLKLGVTCDPVEPPLLGDPPAVSSSGRRYHYPRAVTPELAEFLGLMVANGHVNHKDFSFSSRHQDVRDRLAELSNLLFGARLHCAVEHGAYRAVLGAKEIVGWLHQLGGMEPHNKSVPYCILRSPLSLQIAFLRGLFENASIAVGRNVQIFWSSGYRALAEFVRTMLLRLDIITGAVSTEPTLIAVHGHNARKFGERVGFVARAKQARTMAYAGREIHHRIPLTASEVTPLGTVLREVSAFTPRQVQQRGFISRHIAKAMLSRLEQDDHRDAPSSRAALAMLRDKLGYHYSAVREVRRLTGPSMCIRVPDGHRFLQNGVCGWNSQGSQAPCVVAIVHKSHAFQLQRNLIYTAVTRAQRTVILVGDAWAMRTGAQKTQVERRKTFLSVLDLPRWTPEES